MENTSQDQPVKKKPRRLHKSIKRELNRQVHLGMLGKRLAKDIMSDACNFFFAMSLRFQPTSPLADEEKCRNYLLAATKIAADLAPFESPRLVAVAVSRVDPHEKLSDEELYEELKRRAIALKLPAPPPPPKTIEGVANVQKVVTS